MQYVIRNNILEPVSVETLVPVLDHAVDRYQSIYQNKTLELRPREDTIGYVLENLTSVLIEDQYLLVCSVEEGWFYTNRVLVEQLLLRYRKGDCTTRELMGAIDTLALRAGCDRIHLGTLASPGEALPRLYSRYGYTEQGRSMIKEI